MKKSNSGKNAERHTCIAVCLIHAYDDLNYGMLACNRLFKVYRLKYKLNK